jgi:N-acetylneuraminic acid mutarotase
MKKIYLPSYVTFMICSILFIGWTEFTPYEDYFSLIPVMSSGTPMSSGTGVRYPGAAGFTRNDSAWVYIMGGLLDGSIITSNCYRYNVLSDTWESIAPLSDGPIWISAGARLGNKIYNIGGTNALALNNAQTRVQVYDVSTGTWSTAAPLIYGRTFHAVCSYQDSLIYVAGGWGYPGGLAYNDVYLYNAISNTWRQASSMNEARAGGVLAVSGDTLVYVCGGPNWTNPSAKNIVYRGVIRQTNRALIIWDTLGAVYPPGARNSIYGASWGSKGIIVSGGYTVSSPNYGNECYVYSPGLNQWTQMPNLLSGRTDHGAASVKKGNVWKFINAAGTNNRSGASLTTVNILTDTILPITSINQISNKIPETFKLGQNYPNPFNPVTKFNFEVPDGFANKDIKILLHDVTGRLISVLSNGRYNPGRYEVQFNGTYFPSGIYFYTLSTDNIKVTRTMMLVK